MTYLQGLFEKTYLTDIKESYHIRGACHSIRHRWPDKSSQDRKNNPQRKGVKLTRTTVKEYLEMPEDSFLINRCVRYDIKGRKYIDAPQKYYFEDLGLRNACLRFRQVEEPIHNNLRICGYLFDVGVMSIRMSADGVYSRSQLEVDLVRNRSSERIYVKSAYRLPTEEKHEQEMSSLMKIDDSFRKIIITEDIVICHHDENGIECINIYDLPKSKEKD